MLMIFAFRLCQRTIACLALAVLVFLGAGCQCPQSQPLIVMGTLSPDDVEGILRLIRSDMSGIPQDKLPEKHRKFEPIQGLRANSDGTVDVSTGVQRGPLSGAGHTYKIQKGPKGWEIKSKSRWVSSLTPQPNQSLSNGAYS